MRRHGQARYVGAVVVGGLLALVSSAASAEVTRTGEEPWYQESGGDVLRAKGLFALAVDKHLQLLRGDARDLYDQALDLWDNPDIQWNQALVLEDLGQYLLAHQQLARAARWGEALGAERLRDVRERMQALETQHLARIEASSDEPEAEITLDGQRWFRGAGHRIALVDPGEHYIATRKTGFFPVTRSVSVKAGLAARVALPMDADRLVETRRWDAWKPWIIVSAGVVATAVGAGFERQAYRHRDTAAKSLMGMCDLTTGCPPMKASPAYDRAVRDGWIAAGAFAAGGVTLAVGLTMAWLNQSQVRRTEARAPGPIEVTPILSTDQVGASAQLRF